MENTNKKDLKATESIGVTEIQKQKLRKEVIAEMEAEDNIEFEKVNYLKEMDGEEVWTDAFGERFYEKICVGIQYPNCIHDGKVFKPTQKEIKQIWDDMIENEFGSPDQRQADLEAEFTPEYCKQLFEEEVEKRIKKKLEIN